MELFRQPVIFHYGNYGCSELAQKHALPRVAAFAPPSVRVDVARLDAVHLGEKALGGGGMIGWLSAPRRVVSVDVETTGLGSEDRIVSIGALALNRDQLAGGDIVVDTMHLVFSPGRPSEFRARVLHGYADGVLARQDAFEQHAVDIAQFLCGGDLLVAHNADFDIGFIRAEFARVGAAVALPGVYCTMKAHRAIRGGRADLDAASQAAGFRRVSARHSAMEDAWLSMMVFLEQIGVGFRADYPAGRLAYPTNFRGAISR